RVLRSFPTRRSSDLDGVFNVQRNVMDRWRSPEQPGSGKVPTTMGTGRGRVMFRDTHSLSVEKTDYAWIKNITLGYQLPDRAIKKDRKSTRLNSSHVK